METDTGPFKVLNEITKFIDVDITPEDNLTDFVYQYLNSFPVEFLENVNIREFVTNSKNFYSPEYFPDNYLLTNNNYYLMLY